MLASALLDGLRGVDECLVQLQAEIQAGIEEVQAALQLHDSEELAIAKPATQAIPLRHSPEARKRPASAPVNVPMPRQKRQRQQLQASALFRAEPDFELMSQAYPVLQQYLTRAPGQRAKYNFNSPAAARYGVLLMYRTFAICLGRTRIRKALCWLNQDA